MIKINSSEEGNLTLKTELLDSLRRFQICLKNVFIKQVKPKTYIA